MGGAISGMHYTAMAALTFRPAEFAVVYDSLAIAPPLLAVIIAVATFIYFIFALLSALPDDANWARRRAPGLSSDGHDYIKKLPISQNKKVTLLELAQVIHLQADGHYTAVYTSQDRHLCNLSVSDLETKLDPRMFIRVHRSHIVNIQYAKSFERQTDQATIVVDRNGETRIPVSRDKVQALRTMLGI